jgi:hypothetical protein
MMSLLSKKKRFWVSISVISLVAVLVLVIFLYPRPSAEQQNASAVKSASITLKPLLDELNSSVHGAYWRVDTVGGPGKSLGNLTGGSSQCMAVVYKSKSDWVKIADPKLWGGPVPKVFKDPKTGFWLMWFMSTKPAIGTPCRESFAKVLVIKDTDF